jgi:putative transcriptional regulator
MKSFLAVILLGLAASVSWAADFSEPVLLAARPELGEFYKQTVLLAVPARNGHHIGLILNRPTPMTLSRLFPDHAPSRAVTDPVYLGGPDHVTSIFAVVRGASPGGHSIPLLADLWLVVDVALVDKVIETDPNGARFYAGLVVWDVGELESEHQRGFWTVHEPTSDVVLRRSTQGLWEELTAKARGAL